MIKLFSLNTKMLCIIIIIVLCVLLMYKISCISKEKTIEQFKFKYKNPGCYIFTRNCKNNYWKSVTNGKWFNDEIDGATPIKSLEQCKTKRKEVKGLCQGGYVKHKYIAGKDDTTEKKVKPPGCYIFTRNCKNKYWKDRTNGKMDLVQFNNDGEVYKDKICRQIKKNIQTQCKGGSYVKSKFINSKKFIERNNKIDEIIMDKNLKIINIEITTVLNEPITIDKLFDPNYSQKLAYHELINIKYIFHLSETYWDSVSEIITVDSFESKINNINNNFSSSLRYLTINNIKVEYLKKMNIELFKNLTNLTLSNINIGEDISDIKFDKMYNLTTLELNNTNIGKYIHNLHLPINLNNFKKLYIKNEKIRKYIIGLRLPVSVVYLYLINTDINETNLLFTDPPVIFQLDIIKYVDPTIYINQKPLELNDKMKLLNIKRDNDTRIDTNKGPNEKCFYYYKDGCNLFQGYKNNNWNKYDKNEKLFLGNWVSGCSSYKAKDSDSKNLSRKMCRNLLYKNLTNYVNPPVEIVKSVIKPDEPPKDRGCYVMFNKLCKRIEERDATYLQWEEKSRKLNKWYKDLPNRHYTPSCSDIKSKSKRAAEIENNCGLEPGDVQIISTM
jgi:hypothetical protein